MYFVTSSSGLKCTLSAVVMYQSAIYRVPFVGSKSGAHTTILVLVFYILPFLFRARYGGPFVGSKSGAHTTILVLVFYFLPFLFWARCGVPVVGSKSGANTTILVLVFYTLPFLFWARCGVSFVGQKSGVHSITFVLVLYQQAIYGVLYFVWLKSGSGPDQRKHQKFRVTGLCAGTGEFPAQMASNAEKVSIWWRHHDGAQSNSVVLHTLSWYLGELYRKFHEYHGTTYVDKWRHRLNFKI